jgi:NADP-dependent alcohol dehydrogenase
MQNFEFYNPTRVVFGKGTLPKLDKLVPADANVLITYGRGSAKKSGLIDRVKTILGNRKVHEFGGIEPNPQYETLVKALEIVHKEKIDFLLAVGGGSVIDGTKFIGLSACYEGDNRDLFKYGQRPIPLDVVTKTMPLGTVLTLPAAGSEMNDCAMISYQHGKKCVLTEVLFPRFSILDPTLTFTLPKIQVANGVVDAFVHVTEEYLTYPVAGMLQDRMAEGILQTLIEIGETTVNEPENYDARANLIWCATVAVNRIVSAGVPQDWATHMIGHELTVLFGIDHGQSLAPILPALLDVRRQKKHAKLLQYAERVWHINQGSEKEKIDLAIEKTRKFFESLGIKTRLSEYGVGADKIPALVEQLRIHGMDKLSETEDQTLDISKKILEKAL